MKEENPYVQIHYKNFEYEPLSYDYDSFYEIYDGWDNIRNIKLAKVWKTLKENGVDDEKREKIEDLLFQTDFNLFLNNIHIVAWEEDIKKFSMDTTSMEYKQAIEEFLRRTESIPIINPVQDIVKYLLIQILKRLKVAEKIATDRQKFLNFLDEQKSKIGVKPYPGGNDPHRMPIFRSLIGELGEMLNPFFRGYIVMPRENPENPKRLKMPAAKVIAKLLNGYFINLKVKFNPDMVRKKYNSWLEKKE